MIRPRRGAHWHQTKMGRTSRGLERENTSFRFRLPVVMNTGVGLFMSLDIGSRVHNNILIIIFSTIPALEDLEGYTQIYISPIHAELDIVIMKFLDISFSHPKLGDTAR